MSHQDIWPEGTPVRQPLQLDLPANNRAFLHPESIGTAICIAGVTKSARRPSRTLEGVDCHRRHLAFYSPVEVFGQEFGFIFYFIFGRT